ncbi:MAG: isopentenyl-diphosphate delta-isomerase [Candidatus Aenigmatarchaeota archaeon]
MSEILVLVDELDNIIGFDTKENCHLGEGKLHRGFVVFLFDEENRILVQKRSEQKTLYNGFWDASVASHPLKKEDRIETYEEAARRRLGEELGIYKDVLLERVLDYVYYAPFGKYSEREFCVLLKGEYEGEVNPNPNEIAAYRYLCIRDLRKEIKKNPYAYTPWFKIAFEKFLKTF